MVILKNGISFGEHFVVDPTRKAPLAVVSHAHLDHLRSHEKIIATPATIDLAHLHYDSFEAFPVEYHQKIDLGPAKVKLVPAGHILGSAQVVVDFLGERIVYTGDFKLEENLTCHKAEIQRCDVLLIDTTYGKPHYRFPSLSECRERILDFVSSNIKKGITPVVLAYSVGKSQEAMKLISDEGFEIEAFKNAYQAAQIYRKHGVDIKGVYELKNKTSKDRVVILPPASLKKINAYGLTKHKACFLSGWAVDAKKNTGVVGIPFSDHASFSDIIFYIEEAKPKRIYTLFGPPEMAAYLNRMGFKAEAAALNSGHLLNQKDAINVDFFK